MHLRVAKIRFLTADMALVHVLGHSYAKSRPDEKKQEIVISGVVRKSDGRWEIIAFQNTPVQQVTPRPAPAGGRM